MGAMNQQGQKKLPYKKELISAGNTLVSFLAGTADLVGGSLPLFQAVVNWENHRKFERFQLTLQEVKKRTDKNTAVLTNITTLLNEPSRKGEVLFYRIVKLNDSIEIEDQMFEPTTVIQAKIIENIAAQNFEELFSELVYLLSRLEQLSPQSLWVLNDFDNWPHIFTLGGTTTSGVTLSANWATKFAEAYLNKNGRKLEPEIKTRVADVMCELKNTGFIDLDQSKRVKLTEMGTSAYKCLLSNSSP